MPLLAPLRETPSSPEPGLAEAVAALFPPPGHDETPPVETATTTRRRKLWEIGAGYHCAVIGTCLSIAELRRRARHVGVSEWGSASDYELHHSAVQHARGRNALSALIQKDLERKFALAVTRFAQARTDQEVRALWQEALARGEVAGALWAIMTHPMASERTLCTAGEELHMLSHQAGASNRADLRRAARAQGRADRGARAARGRRRGRRAPA